MQYSPSVNWRIDVAEGEFIRGHLPVGVHVPLAQQEEKLILRKLRINSRHGNHVERRVPRSEPGVLPLIGHRKDVSAEEVTPGFRLFHPLRWWCDLCGITAHPSLSDEVIKLLAPKQAGKGLSGDVALLCCSFLWDLLRVEGVCLRLACCE